MTTVHDCINDFIKSTEKQLEQIKSLLEKHDPKEPALKYCNRCNTMNKEYAVGIDDFVCVCC